MQLSLAHAEESVQNVSLNQDVTAKRFNIELQPMSALSGIYSFVASAAVGERVLIGVQAEQIRSSWLLEKYDGYSVGINSTFYLSSSRFKSGWVLTPSVGYASFKVHDSPLFWFGDYTPQGWDGNFHSMYLGAVMGYQWAFESGLNFSLGSGLTYYTLNKSQTLNSSDLGPVDIHVTFGGLNVAFLGNVGFAF